MTCVNALSLQIDPSYDLTVFEDINTPSKRDSCIPPLPQQILIAQGLINARGEVDQQKWPQMGLLSFSTAEFWQLIPPCEGYFSLSKRKIQRLKELFKDELPVLEWLSTCKKNCGEIEVKFHFYFLDLLDFVFKNIENTNCYVQPQGSFVRHLYYLKARQEALSKVIGREGLHSSIFNDFFTEFENFFSDIDVHYFTKNKVLFSTLPELIVEFLSNHLSLPIESKAFRHYLARYLFQIKEPTFCTGNIYFNLVLKGKEVKIDFSIEDADNKSLCFTGIDALALCIPCKKTQQQEPCYFSVLPGFTLEQTIVDFETKALRLKSDCTFSSEFLQKFWPKYLFYRCYGFEIVSHSLSAIFKNWLNNLSLEQLANSLKRYFLEHRAHNENLRVALLFQGLQFCSLFGFSAAQLKQFFLTYEQGLPPLSQASLFWQIIHSSLIELNQDFSLLQALLQLVCTLYYELSNRDHIKLHPLTSKLRLSCQEELLLPYLKPDNFNLIELNLEKLKSYYPTLQRLLENLFQTITLDFSWHVSQPLGETSVKPLYTQILKWVKSDQPVQQILGSLLLLVAWKDQTLINEVDFFIYCPYLLSGLTLPFLHQLLTDYLQALTKSDLLPVLKQISFIELFKPIKKPLLNHYVGIFFTLYLSLENRHNLQPALELWTQLNAKKQESYLLKGIKDISLMRALAFLRAIQGLEYRHCSLELYCLQGLFRPPFSLPISVWNALESSLVAVLKRMQSQELTAKEVQELFYQNKDFWTQVLQVTKEYSTVATSLPLLLGNVLLKPSHLLFEEELFYLLSHLFSFLHIDQQVAAFDDKLKNFLTHPSFKINKGFDDLLLKRLSVKPILILPLNTLQQHLKCCDGFSKLVIEYYLNNLDQQMSGLLIAESIEVYQLFLRKEFHIFFKQHPDLHILFDRHYLTAVNQNPIAFSPLLSLFTQRLLESFNYIDTVSSEQFAIFKENVELFLHHAAKNSLLKKLRKTFKTKPVSLFWRLKNQQRFTDLFRLVNLCRKKPYELPISSCEANLEPLLDMSAFMLNTSSFEEFIEICNLAVQIHLEWGTKAFLAKKRFDFYSQHLNCLFERALSLPSDDRLIGDFESSLTCWLTIMLNNEAIQPYLQFEHIQKWVEQSIALYQRRGLLSDFTNMPLFHTVLKYFTSFASRVLEQFELFSLQKFLLSFIQLLLEKFNFEPNVLDFCCQCFYHFKLNHLPTFRLIVEAFSKTLTTFTQSKQLFIAFQDIQQKIQHDITQDKSCDYYFCWAEILKRHSTSIPFALQDLLNSLFDFTLWTKDEQPQNLKDLIVFLTTCLQIKNNSDKQLLCEILWRDCYQSLSPFDLKQREIMLLIFEKIVQDKGLDEASPYLKRCGVSLLQLLKFDFGQRHICLLLKFLEHYHGAKKPWEGLVNFYEELISCLRKHLDSDLAPIVRFIVMSNSFSVLKNALDLIVTYRLYQRDKFVFSLEKTNFYLEIVLSKLSYTKEGCTYLALKHLNFNELLPPDKDLKLQFKIALQTQDYQYCLKALITHRNFIMAGLLTPAQKSELRELSVEILVVYLSQLTHEMKGYAFLLDFFKLYTPLFTCEDDLQSFLNSYDLYFEWLSSMSHQPEKSALQIIDKINEVEYQHSSTLTLFSPSDLLEFLQVLLPLVKKISNLTVYSTESTIMFFHFCLFSIHTLLSLYQPCFKDMIATVIETFAYSLFVQGSNHLRSLHYIQLHHFLMLIRNKNLDLPEPIVSRMHFFVQQTPLTDVEFNRQKDHLLASLVLLQQRNLKVFHVQTLQMIDVNLEQIIQDRDFSCTISDFLINTLKSYVAIELSSTNHLQSPYFQFSSDQPCTVYALIQTFLFKINSTKKIVSLERYLAIVCNLSYDLDESFFTALQCHILFFLKRLLNAVSSKDYLTFSCIFQAFIDHIFHRFKQGNLFFKSSYKIFHSELLKLLQDNQIKGSSKQREKDVKCLQKLHNLI